MTEHNTDTGPVEKPDAEQAEAAAAAQAKELKGKELDAALQAAGLPKSGTADEKRERLAAPRPQSATHKNTYGDNVHVNKSLHKFVEGRGYTPL